MKNAKYLAYKIAQSIKREKRLEDQILKKFHGQATNEVKDIIARIDQRENLINKKKIK